MLINKNDNLIKNLNSNELDQKSRSKIDKYGGYKYSKTVFSNVLNGVDVAKFANITSDEQLKTINGLTTKDSWQFVSYMRAVGLPIPNGKTETDFDAYPSQWTYNLSQPANLATIEIYLNKSYRSIKKLKVVLNNNSSFTVELKPNDQKQIINIPIEQQSIMANIVTLEVVSTSIPTLTVKEKKKTFYG